jgi:hypothetical protein
VAKAQADKPNTKFRACKMGCGERFWTHKPGNCQTCRARMTRVGRLNLHVARGTRDVPEYDAAHEERIARLAERAAQGLPLFAA